MKHLLRSLERYGIGTRQMTENDFYEICEARNIEVIHSPQPFAFTFSAESRDFIVLPRRRRGLRLLFSQYHELAHVLCHAGDEPSVMWEGLADSKREFEADAVALVALIPKHKIQALAAEFGETRYGDRLWRDRCRLYFLYGI